MTFLTPNKYVFLFVLTITSCFNDVFAKTIVVGPHEQCSKIKEALTQSNEHDTIRVKNGVYKEGEIIINKSICFLGEGLPTLDGNHKNQVLTISANNVTVSGFKIQNSDQSPLNDPSGIKVVYSKNVSILNNTFIQNFFGIYIQESEACIIKNNVIVGQNKSEQNTGNGIHCWKSVNMLIIGNTISKNRDGIYFEFVTNSTIWRNISHDNLRYGLHFMFSNDDAYYSNLFRANGSGVAVMFTKNIKMENNTFEKNWGDASYGILLKEISDCYMYNNKITKNTTGIVMDGTNRILIQQTLFKENGWGLKIQANCMENQIQENNFIANTFDVATNGSLTLNNIQENYWDKYKGYDLNKDKIGDVPYHPISLYSIIAEINPSAMLLYRSFTANMIDQSEKLAPSITPNNFKDSNPKMNAFKI